jgi:hypothetical protein
MGSVGPVYPGTLISAGSWFYHTTSIIAALGANDTNYAYCTVGSYNACTVRNFDFSSIPDGSTIDGIVLDIDLKDGGVGTAYIRFSLSWDGGSSWTSTKDESTTSTSDVAKSFGGTTDTWGRTFTAAEIKSTTNFQVKMEGYNTFSSYCYVDFLRITVYYH